MINLVLLIIPLGWLAISSLIYWLIVRRWVKTESVGAHVAFGLLGAIFLAPGLLVGHGFAPFPGGVAFLLLLAYGAIENVAWINLGCWLVTAAVLAPLGWWAVRRGNAE